MNIDSSWQRLEVRTRDRDLVMSVQAPVHDPLWLLARQWQWGEFQGEDAASPVATRLSGESNPLRLYRPGTGTAQRAMRYNPAAVPLEALVEREPPPSDGTQAAASVEAGLTLLRRLRQGGVHEEVVQAMREQYPVPALGARAAQADRKSTGFLRVMAGRGVDGRKAHAEISGAIERGQLQSLLSSLGVDLNDNEAVATVTGVLENWQAWYREMYGQGIAVGSAWVPSRMEYAFAVAAPRGSFQGIMPDDVLLEPPELDLPNLPEEDFPPIVLPDPSGSIPDPTGPRIPAPTRRRTRSPARQTTLTARGYTGGRLDWYAFEESAGDLLDAQVGPPQPPLLRTLVPTHVGFPGMPAPRWWTIEDGAVNLGYLDPAPEDLGRLILSEFALGFGNDWFIVPLDLGVGTVTRLSRMEVMNAFGERLLLDPVSRSSAKPWRMFELTRPAEPEPPEREPLPFLLAPALPPYLQSRPVEEVRLLRDEMANLAWAVQRVAPSSITGLTVDRFEHYQQKQQQQGEGPARTALAPLAYRIATDVPDYWVPLVPQRLGSADQDAIRLDVGRLLNTEQGHAGEAHGELLRVPLALYEEEVPRAGVQLTRAYQYARWSDGSAHLWIGRRKVIGHGEGASGLRYDVVESVEVQV